MLSVQLDPEIEARLERLARLTGRTMADYIREAILEHLQDLEDAHLAAERLENPTQAYSAEEAKRELKP